MPQDPEQWSAATPAERLLLDEGASTPRANFDNLLNAVLAVFQICTRENWQARPLATFKNVL